MEHINEKLDQLDHLLNELRNLEQPDESRDVLANLRGYIERKSLTDELAAEMKNPLLKLEQESPEQLPSKLGQSLHDLFSGLNPEQVLESGFEEMIDEMLTIVQPKLKDLDRAQPIQESKEMIDKKLEGFPFHHEPGLDSAQDDELHERTSTAETLIAEGNELIERLATHLTEVADDVDALFRRHVDPPQGIEQLREELQQAAFIEQISEDDQVWDEAVATAYNAFVTGNVDHSGQMQKARANWELAVRKYRSESRNAWRIWKAGLGKLPKSAVTSSDQCNSVYDEVKHYKRSTEISGALLTYEQARAQATSDLATAYGELVKGLFDSAGDAAVGKATLIQAIESASETFWTSVQDTMDNPS